MDREDLRYYLGSMAECEHEGIIQVVSVTPTDKLGFMQHIKATEAFDQVMEDTFKTYHILCGDNSRVLVHYTTEWKMQWIPWVFNN